jgi:hypothetical protein
VHRGGIINGMKKIFILGTLIALFVAILAPSIVLSATKTFVPLVPGSPLSVTEEDAAGQATGAGLATLVNKYVKIAIQLASMLAVIMIIVGGVQYVSTDSWTGKEDGKQKIKAALGGLALALASFLILNTIDPNLTTLNFNIEDIKLDANRVDISVSKGLPPGTSPGSNSSGSGNSSSTSPGSTDPNQPATHINGFPLDSSLTIRTINGTQYACGKISEFGGPNDKWVGPQATGAITGERLQALDPNDFYIAARWDYAKTPRNYLLANRFTMVNLAGRPVSVRAVDWGPDLAKTGRAFDVSPGVARALGVKTDDILCIGISPNATNV